MSQDQVTIVVVPSWLAPYASALLEGTGAVIRDKPVKVIANDLVPPSTIYIVPGEAEDQGAPELSPVEPMSPHTDLFLVERIAQVYGLGYFDRYLDDPHAGTAATRLLGMTD